MPTRAQIRANRNNAKKSTGPHTEEGKARVSKNALKHGLLAGDRYTPAQAPPSIANESPTAGRIGFRASREDAPQTGLPDGQVPVPQAALTKTTKQTQFRQTQVKSTPSRDEPRSADLAVEIRGLSAPPLTDSTSPSGAASPYDTGNQHSGHMKASDSFVAHAFLRAVSPFVATSSFLCGARSQRAASRLFSTPGAGSTTNDQTNPIFPNPGGIRAIQWSRHARTNE